MEIHEFVQARIDDAERGTEGLRLETVRHLRFMFDSMRAVMEMHKNWPVLVEMTPPEVRVEPGDDFLGQVKMSMVSQYDFMLGQEYIKHFGQEPPTTPMIQCIASIWADHPDFEQKWWLSRAEFYKSLGVLK